MSVSLEEFRTAVDRAFTNKGFVLVRSVDAVKGQVPGKTMNGLQNAEVQPRASNGYFDVNGDSGTLGVTNQESKIVAIRDDLSPTDELLVSVHELAHVYLHQDMEEKWLSGGEGIALIGFLWSFEHAMAVFVTREEFEAESTAHAVLARFGFANDEWSEGYLDNYTKNIPDEFLDRDTRNINIDTGVSSIVADLESQLALVSAA